MNTVAIGNQFQIRTTRGLVTYEVIQTSRRGVDYREPKYAGLDPMNTGWKHLSWKPFNESVAAGRITLLSK